MPNKDRNSFVDVYFSTVLGRYLFDLFFVPIFSHTAAKNHAIKKTGLFPEKCLVFFWNVYDIF